MHPAAPSPTSGRPSRLRLWLALLLALTGAVPAWSLDEVILTNGRRYLGEIVSSTRESVVLSIDGGTVEFPRAIVASPPYLGDIGSPPPIEKPAGNTSVPAAPGPPHPLPNVANALRKLRAFSWASDIRQVPVLVTDHGRWQFLPCVSFWVGDFFQLAFLGDPARPTAVEVSLHRPPPTAWEEKRRLLEFMLSLAPGLAVDNRFDQLDVAGDQFTVGDLWFEVTGPENPKSPGRWVVLLLHEGSLPTSRASYEELAAVSEPLTVATIDPAQPRSWQRGSWTPDDLAWVRQAPGTPVVPGAAAPAGPEGGLRPAAWTALGGERVYVRAFVRERGRYARAAHDWLRDVAAAP